MGKLVRPEVFLIGCTTIDADGLDQYLHATGNQDFLASIAAAKSQGISDGEILTSFFAKLCYASLTVGKNKNISRVRDIPDNLRSTWDQAHGSVWEHVYLNFVATNCSRVYTHEQVRHRVGTAYSHTSGLYVRGDAIDIVFAPILEPVRDLGCELQQIIEYYYRQMVAVMHLDNIKDFTRKKKITAALRRYLPNGQSNEIGFSLNLRSLRHIIQLRTSCHAEWEIREIYSQVYALTKDRWPLLYH